MENNLPIVPCERLAGVKEFNVAFKHPVYDNPVPIIDVEYVKKRIAYMVEEQNELLEAAEAGDIVGVLDALLDIDYFNLGTVFGMGLEKEFQEGFKIVQASNMAKLCTSEAEVEETQAMYTEQGVATSFAQVLPGKWAVYNAQTGKVMKSVNYQAPDLAKLFPVL